MKAVLVPEHGRLEVVAIRDPAPGPHDCLVRIDACAICTGTDQNIMTGRFPWLTGTPFVIGHESTGVIVAAGPRVRNFRLGQRVTRPAGILPNDRVDGIGSNWGGCAELGLVRDVEAARADGAEYASMPAGSRVPLPDDTDAVSAALSINQREIMSVVARMSLGALTRVVVIGTGYNGLLFSLFFRHFGAGRVVVVGSAGRELLARRSFGAEGFADYTRRDAAAAVRDQLGGAPTHLVDAVGTVASLTLARDLLDPATAFGRYGLHEFDRIGPLTEELQKSHPALAMGADEVAATDAWLRAWREGLFDRDGICDGLMPMDDVMKAFDQLARRQAVKLVLTM